MSGDDVSRETSVRARSVTRSEWAHEPGDYTRIAAHFADSIFEMLQVASASLEREVRGAVVGERRLVTLVLSVEAEVEEP